MGPQRLFLFLFILVCLVDASRGNLAWQCGLVLGGGLSAPVVQTLGPGESGFMRCSIGVVNAELDEENELLFAAEQVVLGACPYVRPAQLEFISQWNQAGIFRQGSAFFIPFVAPLREAVIQYEVSTTMDTEGLVVDYANSSALEQQLLVRSPGRVQVTALETGNTPLNFYGGGGKLGGGAISRESLIRVGERGVQPLQGHVVASLALSPASPAPEALRFVDRMRGGGVEGVHAVASANAAATVALVPNRALPFVLLASNEPGAAVGGARLARVDESVVADNTKDCGYALHSVAALRSGVLINGNRGLHLVSPAAANGSAAVLDLLGNFSVECLGAVHVLDDASAPLLAAVAQGSFRVFYVSIHEHLDASVSASAHELLGAQNETLLQHAGGAWTADAFPVDLAVFAMAPDAPYVLVSTGARVNSGKPRYALHWLSPGSNSSVSQWTRRSTLPVFVNGTTHALNDYRASLVEGDDGSDEVEVAGMAASDTLLYVYGSVLMASADFGASWVLLNTFAPATQGTVSSFAVGSNQVSYTLLTSAGELWYGESSGLTVRMGGVEEAALQPNKFYYYVQQQADLQISVIGLRRDSDCAGVGNDPSGCLSKSAGLAPSTRAATARRAAELSSHCPYSAAEVRASDGVEVTRRVWELGAEGADSSLPSPVFLDFGQAYNFSLRLTVSPLLARESEPFLCATLAFHLVGAAVRMDKQCVVSRDRGGQTFVEYAVKVTDTMRGGAGGEGGGAGPVQSAPGEGLAASVLTIGLREPSWACGSASPLRQGFGTEPSSDALSRGMAVTFHSGCAPKQQLYFDAVASRYFIDHCRELQDGFPCLSYSFTLKPQLFLLDQVSNRARPYEQAYTFEVVGGSQGPHHHPDSIAPYTQDESDSFNLGRKTIWLVENGLGGNTLTKGSILTWVCGVGSPCSGVVPTFGESPSYYMRVRISTGGANRGTYCDYSTELVLRLHGLQMDYITLIMISGTSVLCLFSILALAYLLVRRKYMVFHGRVQVYIKRMAKETAARNERSKFTRGAGTIQEEEDAFDDIPDEVSGERKGEGSSQDSVDDESGGIEMTSLENGDDFPT